MATTTCRRRREYILRGEVLYRNVSGFFVGPTFDFVGKRFADFSNSYTVGSYGLLGLRGGFTGASGRCSANCGTLCDKEYVATLSVLNEAAPDSPILNPGAPRSAYIGVRVQL